MEPAAAYAPEDFNADIIVQRILWRRMFVINEPEAIRHVVLDNAANYTKSEVGRRLLEPGLGRGLLTSEGETWRRHRRIMAPAFDPRSVAGYAPIMTEVTQGLLATMVAHTAPAQLRGTAFGFFNLLSGIVTLVSSVIAGALWDRLGAAATFYAGMGFCLLTIALLLSGWTPKPITRY